MWKPKRRQPDPSPAFHAPDVTLPPEPQPLQVASPDLGLVTQPGESGASDAKAGWEAARAATPWQDLVDWGRYQL